MLELIPDLFQDFSIDNLRTDVHGQAANIDLLQTELMRSQRQIHKLTLAVEALAEILSERNDITREVILAKITEIDRRDGRLDGRINPEAVFCTECDRTFNANMAKCVYCGADRPPSAGVVC